MIQVHSTIVALYTSMIVLHTLQYVVFIVVGTGIFFTIVFHVGVKEHPRDCSAQFATKSSKRSAANWTAWFHEPLFYQVTSYTADLHNIYPARQRFTSLSARDEKDLYTQPFDFLSCMRELRQCANCTHNFWISLRMYELTWQFLKTIVNSY